MYGPCCLHDFSDYAFRGQRLVCPAPRAADRGEPHTPVPRIATRGGKVTVIRHTDRSSHLFASIRNAAIWRLRNLPLAVLLSQFFGTNRTSVSGSEASRAARTRSRRQRAAAMSFAT